MEAVCGLLLMLLGVSHGVETKCDVRQKDGAQCYGPLGGTVVLKLVDQEPERFDIQKNKSTILRLRNKTISPHENKDKYSFTSSDGTFRINNLIRSDTDNYTLIIHNSTGDFLEKRTLQLSIQAPVLSVRLVSECLSQGEKRVSCSSEGGERLQYSWTLGGRTLTEDTLLSGNQTTDNITLRQNVSGDLLCSVKNHVSNIETKERISTCGFIFINCTVNETRISKWVFEANNTLCVEPTTTPTTADPTVGKKTPVTVSLRPSISITSSNQTVTSSIREVPWFIIMAGFLAALVVLLVVGGAVFYALKKNKTNQLEEEGDEQELTYADVRIKQRGQVQERANPEEVEYGQIRFSERPRRTVEPRDDDCVYAKVR